MSRVLIVYASHFGQTRAIAQRIADRLRDRGHEVEIANALDGLRGLPPPQDYDGVLLGSRIEYGKHATPLLHYIEDHRLALTKLPTAFFSVSNSAAAKHDDADPNHYLAKTFAQLHWTPNECAAFGGSLRYREYGWLLRFMMKQISKRAGHPTDTSRNHYFTDFSAVVDFTDRFCWYLDERDSVVHL